MNTESPVSRVGQIPNVLALAHYLSTTPSFGERAAFVVAQDAREKRLLVDILNILPGNMNPAIFDIDNAFSWSNIAESRLTIASRDDIEEDVLPQPKAFRKQTLTLAVKDNTTDLSSLKDFLTLAGYERETTANMPGRWSIRGDVIDVFTTQPHRIEFDGNTITRISTFDIGTGKSLQECESLMLPPLHLNGTSTAWGYLPEGTLVVSIHAEALDIPHEQVLIEPFVLDGEENAGYEEAKSYHLRYEQLQQDTQGAEVTVLTSEKEKVESVLPNAKIIELEETIPVRGVVLRSQNIHILTDASIGFAEQKAKKRSAKMAQQLLQQLTPGDYVVHMYHGVARFAGMDTMKVNDMEREYFILEYDGKDKIYLPVELAERIDKYVGEENPTLHKLTSASWSEAVARVKEQSLETARELLNLYAQREHSRAPQLAEHAREETKFDDAFPYDLTEDQQTTLAEILKDMSQEKPMDRLLCGDVGFGKTEVAMRAALRAVLNGYQVAVLAPTTVLVQQHFDTFTERFAGMGIEVRVLSRIQTDAEQRRVIEEMQSGKAHIVVGTHRLLSRDVGIQKLGLFIVDEEQRFGVKAKDRLKHLRKNAHVLTMTATPIPRTLHFSLSGIRDISTILTPPSGRQESTITIQRLSEDVVREALTRELQRGGQAYYLYNRVRSIHQREIYLQGLFPKARIGVAHGQMKPKELSDVMHKFDVGEIDILLATTIVENGIDIANANTLIVEDASKFGLSELYQLKGRVGRSDRQGYAYFLYKEQTPDGDAKKRFIALQDAQRLGSGFELAMRDMEIRGVGNMLGKEQHGSAVKIGVNLYVRLLNQAMKEMQGIEEEPIRDVPIDLPLEARIPEHAMEDVSERIMLYQRLANITDRDELLKQRFTLSGKAEFQHGGKFDPIMEGLFDLLEIKLLASHSPLLSIDTTYPNKTNRVTSPRITLTSSAIFKDVKVPWDYLMTKEDGVHKIRATLEELGDNWITQVKAVIEQHTQSSTSA